MPVCGLRFMWLIFFILCASSALICVLSCKNASNYKHSCLTEKMMRKWKIVVFIYSSHVHYSCDCCSWRECNGNMQMYSVQCCWDWFWDQNIGQHKNHQGNNCLDGMIASTVVIELYILYLEHFNCGVLPKLGMIFL